MQNQEQKIEAATKALNTYVEASKADDWTDELEMAQYEALSAAARAGWDWEDDAVLVKFCLKATQDECADATRKHFLRWAKEQQQPVLGDDIVARAQQLAADVAAQDGLDAEQAAAFEQCMMDNLAQEGLL